MTTFDLPWGPPNRGGGARDEEEALDMLAEARQRLIRDGYRVAVELAKSQGAVHSQMVLAEMEARGLFLEIDESIPRNWTANIFKGKDYKDTWEPCDYVKIGDSSRNTHAAVRRLWKLKGDPDPSDVKAFEAVSPELSPPGSRAPVRPSNQEIGQAVEVYRTGLRFAMRHGFRLEHSQALRRVGLWLRFLAGEDVSLELAADEAAAEDEQELTQFDVVGTCSVCKETQYASPSGPVCQNGHGGAASLENV